MKFNHGGRRDPVSLLLALLACLHSTSPKSRLWELKCYVRGVWMYNVSVLQLPCFQPYLVGSRGWFTWALNLKVVGGNLGREEPAPCLSLCWCSPQGGMAIVPESWWACVLSTAWWTRTVNLGKSAASQAVAASASPGSSHSNSSQTPTGLMGLIR